MHNKVNTPCWFEFAMCKRCVSGRLIVLQTKVYDFFFIQSIEERDALGQMKIITGVLAVDGRRLVDASPLIDLQRWPAMQLSPSWTQARHCRVVMTYCGHLQNMSIRKADIQPIHRF